MLLQIEFITKILLKLYTKSLGKPLYFVVTSTQNFLPFIVPVSNNIPNTSNDERSNLPPILLSSLVSSIRMIILPHGSAILHSLFIKHVINL